MAGDEVFDGMADIVQLGIDFLLPEFPNAVRFRLTGGEESNWGDMINQVEEIEAIYVVVNTVPARLVASEHGGFSEGDVYFAIKANDLVEGDFVAYNNKRYRVRMIESDDVGDEVAAYQGVMSRVKDGT